MKALVLEKYNHLIYKDVPDPVPAPGEVLVKVKACGICGSDVHGLDGSTGRRIPPLIMGHEASGVIEDVGSEVKGWKKGDRVTFDSTVYPLNDWYTIHGKYNLSDNREVLGVSPGTYRRNGAFAEYVVIPEHILYHIPDNVTFEQAATVEPVAVALHSINISCLKPGEICSVTGTGMIGIFIVKLLKISGASSVIALDVSSDQLERAKKAGADFTVNAGSAESLKQIHDPTSGRGVDISFEAAGLKESVSTAINIVRKGGKVILVGNITPVVELPLQRVVTSEVTIHGSCAICGEYETVLGYLGTGKISVEDQISAVAPLSEGAMWFDRLKRKECNPGKVILVP